MSNQDLEQYLWERRELILDRAQYSTLYHRRRERFFDFLDRLTKAIAIIGGSASFAKLSAMASAPGGDIATWAAAAVTITSTLGLVFGLADRARRHNDLARQFATLEVDMMAAGERSFTEPDINRWDAKIREIEASEPPALRKLVIACQNEMAIAHNQAEHVHPLNWWDRMTMHFV